MGIAYVEGRSSSGQFLNFGKVGFKGQNGTRYVRC